MLKVSAFYLEKKNIPKKIFFSQYQNKKALFTDPIFSEGFENDYSGIWSSPAGNLGYQLCIGNGYELPLHISYIAQIRLIGTRVRNKVFCKNMYTCTYNSITSAVAFSDLV